MSFALAFARTRCAAARQFSGWSRAAAVPSAATATTARAAPAARRTPAVRDREQTDAGAQRETARRDGERGSGVDRGRDARREYEEERHHREPGDERGPPAPLAGGAAVQRDDPPDRQRCDEGAPAERATGAGADVSELERARAVRSIGAIDPGRDEEDAACDDRDGKRRHGEPQVELPPRERRSDELCSERAHRDRVREREQHRAQGVRSPPEGVAPFHGPREERARDEHRSERERQRADGARERDDSHRRGEYERRHGTGIPPGETAAEQVHRSRGHDAGDRRRQAKPELRVALRRDRLEQREVARLCRVVRDRPVDDVGEGALRGGEQRGLVHDERATAERDQTEHGGQRRAEERQRAVEDGDEPPGHGDRLVRRRLGVGRSAHPHRGYRRHRRASHPPAGGTGVAALGGWYLRSRTGYVRIEAFE